MADTRFHNDPARIKKSLQESTFSQRYMLGTPAPETMGFIEDPHMRLQYFSANAQTNALGVEDELRGLTRYGNKSHLDLHKPNGKATSSSAKTYGTVKPFIDNTRVSNPAWMLRETETLLQSNPNQVNPLAYVTDNSAFGNNTRFTHENYTDQSIQPCDFMRNNFIIPKHPPNASTR